MTPAGLAGGTGVELNLTSPHAGTDQEVKLGENKRTEVGRRDA